MVSPGASFPRVLASTFQLPASSAARNRPDQRPPVRVRRPANRAGIDAGIVQHQAIAAAQDLRQIPHVERDPASRRRRRTTSSRASDRRSSGRCAINSRGRW